MKSWAELVYGVRNAVLGREVREDFAQALEYIEQFANTAGENIKSALDGSLTQSDKAAEAYATGVELSSMGQLLVLSQKEGCFTYHYQSFPTGYTGIRRMLIPARPGQITLQAVGNLSVVVSLLDF